jgi:gamma-glutamyltranspeptidase / glutathione hydrolase
LRPFALESKEKDRGILAKENTRVSSKSAMVVSSHPLASQAGVKILRRGGNAVDAAVGTALTLGVVSPAFSGIGGGGFMLVYEAKNGKSSVVDYRETAPLDSKPDMFTLDSHGDVINEENSTGFKAIATPATLTGLSLAIERFGTESFADVSREAIRFGREGFAINNFLSRAIKTKASLAKFEQFNEAGKMMTSRSGEGIAGLGDILTLANLANLLERASRSSVKEFYLSEFSDAISEFVRSRGGLLSPEDFKRYQPIIRRALIQRCGEYDVVSIPPPSSGGVCLIQLLKILGGSEDFRVGQRHNSAKYIDMIARSLEFVYEDRKKTIADPDFVSVDYEKLVSDSYVASLKTEETGSDSTSHSSVASQTSHLSVVDFEGNIVALTESLECYFGSGVVIPEFDLFLNDTMHDFDPEPSSINSIKALKRPRSSMSPTILLEDERPFLVLGSAGGPRIISSVLQTILKLTEHEMDIEEAVQSPRIHYEGGRTKTLYCENGISDNTKLELKSLGYNPDESQPDYFFGGVNAIHLKEGKVLGAADQRRNGAAISCTQN